MMAVGQIDPVAGSPTAVVGTFLLTAAVYALTLHVAARYVLGDISAKLSVPVGVVLAAVAFAGQRNHPAVVLVASVAVDLVAIRLLYETSYGLTALITLVHYTVVVLLGVTLYNLVALLSTAPG
jgi:hypothetical protein